MTMTRCLSGIISLFLIMHSAFGQNAVTISSRKADGFSPLELAKAKMEISQLDWILLSAKLDSINEHPAMQLIMFGKDFAANRLIAIVHVDPVWYKSTPSEKATTELRSAAIAYCTNVFIEFRLVTGVGVGADGLDQCRAQFEMFYPQQNKYAAFAVFDAKGIALGLSEAFPSKPESK